jgi:hypothetical protein
MAFTLLAPRRSVPNSPQPSQVALPEAVAPGYPCGATLPQPDRTISDLELLSEENLEILVTETSVTKFALERAREAVQNDAEIKCMRLLGQTLGPFWEHDEKPQ